MNNKQNDNEDFSQWLQSDHLYEKYLFFYFIIIACWGVVGFFTLGFDLSAYTDKQNLVLNFIWLCFICFMMALTPFWYRFYFGGDSELVCRSDLVFEKLNEIDDDKTYKATYKHLVTSGKLPPTRIQLCAMIALGCWAMCEIFIISAEFRDYAIVWYPQWMQNMVEWAINCTDYRPSKVDGFYLFVVRSDLSAFDFLHISPFKQMGFNTAKEFFNSDLGHCIIAFSLWRWITIIPLTVCCLIVFGKTLDSLGFYKINLKNTNGIYDFIGRAVASVFTSFFLIVIIYFTEYSHMGNLYILSKYQWASNFLVSIIAMLIFFTLAVKAVLGGITLIVNFFILTINYIRGMWHVNNR